MVAGHVCSLLSQRSCSCRALLQGYGLVYAGISTNEHEVRKCTGVTILLSLEAYLGMLYAAFSGAIFMAKVARVQCHAHVEFSDPIVIRYGNGVYDAADRPDGEDAHQIPCPVLEFRLVNLMSVIPGGELIDASINIVASVDVDQAADLIGKGPKRRKRGKNKKGATRRTIPQVRRRLRSMENPLVQDAGNEASTSGSSSSPNSFVASFKPDYSEAGGFAETTESDISQMIRISSERYEKSRQQVFDEDPTGHLVPRRTFAKLEVETPDHPFFKRSWLVRHVLDELSPLLCPHARQMVVKNNGFWPPELNSYEGVRSAVLFDQILVSLSGTSNADANSVYAQHIYEFCDVNVGYTFVNVLFRDKNDGTLYVDHRLVNDVVEQDGGGGEPLATREGYNTGREMVVL